MAAGSPTGRRRAPLTRERIVETALVEIEESGAAALSLRSLGRSLGVTAPAIYDHVANKDDLIREVAAIGWQQLYEQGGEHAAVERAIDRCMEQARGYVDFAMARPELFRVMFQFGPAAVRVPADNELPEASKIFDRNTTDLAEAIRDGDLVDRSPVQLALTIWAAVHGVATVGLLMRDLTPSLRDDVVEAIFAGLRPGATD